MLCGSVKPRVSKVVAGGFRGVGFEWCKPHVAKAGVGRLSVVGFWKVRVRITIRESPYALLLKAKMRALNSMDGHPLLVLALAARPASMTLVTSSRAACDLMVTKAARTPDLVDATRKVWTATSALCASAHAVQVMQVAMSAWASQWPQDVQKCTRPSQTQVFCQKSV